jgi:cellulose biosynthesis protein BcsQ
VIVATFSGSKGGTGKTTLAVSLSLAISLRVETLLVDASTEGGATAYLLGDCPGPYLSEDPDGSLRRIEADELQLTVAVNRGSLLWPGKVADSVEEWSKQYHFIIIDQPALTDVDAVERYMPLLKLADTVLIVTEPNSASIEASLYKFGGKRVVVALNQPRPYPKTVVEHYRRVVEHFCRKHGYEYVLVPYEPAVSRLSPSILKVFKYTSDDYDSVIAKLANILLQ